MWEVVKGRLGGQGVGNDEDNLEVLMQVGDAAGVERCEGCGSRYEIRAAY